MARVFLVDRDHGIRAALREALEAVGHTVTDAADAKIALSLLRLATRPGVVLVDYTNLWSDGATFVQAVAADPILAGRHVYILTTTDRTPIPAVIIDRLTGRSIPVLRKPFDVQTLLALVETAAASIATAPIPPTAIPAIPRAWRREQEARAGRRSNWAYTGTSKHGAGERPRRKQSGNARLSRPETTEAMKVAVATSQMMSQASVRANSEAQNSSVGREADAHTMDTMDMMAGEYREAVLTAADYCLASRYARGMADGHAAATIDALGFTSYGDVLQMAWDVSCARADVPPLAQQEEYCIGWAHGYTGRAGEMEGVPDTWEDDGGRIA
jgi:CheY-like chemotaxis protein